MLARCIAAIKEALGARNYSLVLAINKSGPDGEYRSARKLLGLGARRDPAFLQMQIRRQVPCVFTSIWTGRKTPHCP